jgi:uncharacterized protein YgbK (DUF1537 family)
MLLGVIADDFTGASDIANTLARGQDGGGLRTVQYLGVPSGPVETDCEAGVISLKTRSIPTEDAVRQSLEALAWLRAQGCRQFIFKYCSTFDSTPEGNIGPVGEALARELGVSGVVACPAFPTMKRTVYMGHLFVGDRLLNESGLQNHPLNPMTDPDIRRWLARQCTEPVGLVSALTVGKGADAIRSALDEAGQRGERLVIVDAIDDADLVEIGRACADAPLLTGGSGIAIGLPENFILRGEAKGGGAARTSISGAEAILAGSCSGATLEQINVHTQRHPVKPVDAAAVMSGKADIPSLLAFIKENEGKAPLVYSSGNPDEVKAAQDKYGRHQVATAIENLFSDLAKAVVDSGIRRLVVAGGETSGAVVSALGLEALTIGPEIDPGVPVLYTQKGAPLALALKSGNFGAPDFFTKALAAMEGRA